jgi:hypothetical protein
MPREDNTTYIILSGGLGNQLFQLAAAIFHADGNQVVYNSTIGKPRLENGHRVQVECFDLPDFIRWDSKETSIPLFSKIYGYTLRSGFNPNLMESVKFMKRLINFSAKITLLIFTGKLFKVLVGRDVGYSPLSKEGKNSALIGYYQSYKWLEDPFVAKTFSLLKAKDFKTREDYLSEARNLQPVLIHVRLTDYVLENDFGLLSATYYKNAISELGARLGNVNKIHFWVFSDDISSARLFLDFLEPEKVTWISEIEDCPVKTLEVMSMCSHFIIGNSTFSWWAASLRKNQDAEIIYPDPWFKSAPSPKSLIPKTWVPIKASWRN